MTNRLSLSKDGNGLFCTNIKTNDGVSVMELHILCKSDADTLNALLERNYYQQFSGDWLIIFEYDNCRITRPKFSQAVEAAQLHIFNRDNLEDDYTGFY